MLKIVYGHRLFLQFLSMKLHLALIGPFQDHSISDRSKLLLWLLCMFSENLFGPFWIRDFSSCSGLGILHFVRIFSNCAWFPLGSNHVIHSMNFIPSDWSFEEADRINKKASQIQLDGSKVPFLTRVRRIRNFAIDSNHHFQIAHW